MNYISYLRKYAFFSSYAILDKKVSLTQLIFLSTRHVSELLLDISMFLLENILLPMMFRYLFMDLRLICCMTIIIDLIAHDDEPSSSKMTFISCISRVVCFSFVFVLSVNYNSLACCCPRGKIPRCVSEISMKIIVLIFQL